MSPADTRAEKCSITRKCPRIATAAPTATPFTPATCAPTEQNTTTSAA